MNEETKIFSMPEDDKSDNTVENPFDDKAPGDSGKKNSFFIKELYEWIELFAMALVCVILVFSFLFRYVRVDGESMRETLQDNDRLIISNLFYTPQNGDIVVLKVDGFDDPLIKRVIATENQVVDIDFDTWTVRVDGEVVDEPYIKRTLSKMNGMYNLQYPYTVSEGCVFVMGDNRNGSTDSRAIGEIETKYIIGHAIFRVFPFDDFGNIE